VKHLADGSTLVWRGRHLTQLKLISSNYTGETWGRESSCRVVQAELVLPSQARSTCGQGCRSLEPFQYKRHKKTSLQWQLGLYQISAPAEIQRFFKIRLRRKIWCSRIFGRIWKTVRNAILISNNKLRSNSFIMRLSNATLTQHSVSLQPIRF